MSVNRLISGNNFEVLKVLFNKIMMRRVVPADDAAAEHLPASMNSCRILKSRILETL
jgi:hypothetical protein